MLRGIVTGSAGGSLAACWLLAGAATASDTAQAPPSPLPPCSAEAPPRRGSELRSNLCRRPKPVAPTEASDFSFFNLPSKGLALKAGVHVGANGGRVGVSLEPGLSYFFGQRRFELGLSAQFSWLSQMQLYGHGPGVRDFLILPRWNGSVGFDADGFWRLHLSAGYGVAQLRSELDYPVGAQVEHSVWSYGVGLGVSAGIFHIAIQRLGHLTDAGATVIDSGEGVSPPSTPSTPVQPSAAGTLVSVGLVFPIPLSGSD